MNPLDLTDDVWGWLRGTRWRPPAVAATTPERRKTYISALEQAEQFFRAAAGASPAASPILIFYGLSQAGRAIAAAANSATADRWQLTGHGITQAKGTLAGPLPAVPVYTRKAGNAGSFVRLSELLGSPLWDEGDAIRFAALWDSLPENRLTPLEDADESRRTPLCVEDRHVYEARETQEPHPLVSVDVCKFPPWVASSPNPTKALDDYLSSFPDARGYHSYVLDPDCRDAKPDFTVHRSDGWSELRMNWQVPDGQIGTPAEQLGFWKTVPRSYGDARYFFPALGANTASLHPLMTWWAVLHTLSMLARYQPAEWSDHIDVDRSRYAVPLESLLNRALEFLPRLIAYTIDEVCDGELTSR